MSTQDLAAWQTYAAAALSGVLANKNVRPDAMDEASMSYLCSIAESAADDMLQRELRKLDSNLDD